MASDSEVIKSETIQTTDLAVIEISDLRPLTTVMEFEAEEVGLEAGETQLVEVGEEVSSHSGAQLVPVQSMW